MRRALLSLAVATALFGTQLPIVVEAQTVSDSRFRLRRVASLSFPTGMQFTPSGDRLFVNERGGRIRIIKRGRLLATPFATIATRTGSEGGLLGLALHPRFERGEPWVYVFYTRTDADLDRVERLRASGDRATTRQVVFDNIPAARYHHGGSVAFGRDGMLYISNGEQHDTSRAQDPSVLGGKVYRVTPTGSIPSDNPFPGEPTFAYGLRNPFGMGVDPNGGRIWVTENGPNDHDELNLIVRGGNYGWPEVRGDANQSPYRDPVIDYPQIIVPTMLTFGGSALPSAYRGNLFFGTYGQQTIHRVVLNSGRTTARSDRIFIRPGEGVVGMTMGPDGLYFTTPTRVMRAYVPAAPRPPAPAPAPSAPKKAMPKPSPTPTPTTPSPTPTLSVSLIPSPSATGSSVTAAPPSDAGPPWGLIAAGVALLAGVAIPVFLRITKLANKP